MFSLSLYVCIYICVCARKIYLWCELEFAAQVDTDFQYLSGIDFT